MKTYKTEPSSPYLQIDMTVNTKDGRKVPVSFSGGISSPYRIEAMFQTNDKDVAEALENHPRYGSWFVLVGGTIDSPVAESDEPVIPNKFKVVMGVDAPEFDGDLVHNVFNLTEAKRWLNDNKGLPYSKMRNTEEVNKYCKENNITFPDWEQK